MDELDLPTLVARLRAIADDCFDMRAIERLRNLADDIERRTGMPPIILTRGAEGSHKTDD